VTTWSLSAWTVRARLGMLGLLTACGAPASDEPVPTPDLPTVQVAVSKSDLGHDKPDEHAAPLEPEAESAAVHNDRGRQSTM